MCNQQKNNFTKGKKALVTGGAGFIGAHTARRLALEGYSVVVVDNFNDYYSPQLKRDRVESVLSGVECKVYELDIVNYGELDKVFYQEEFDVVVHQAAQAGVRHSFKDPFIYQKYNIEGTINVLECCQKYGIKKLVFASSSSVYGERKDTPFKESDFTDTPSSLYAATKKMTEVMCYSYHSSYKMPMVGLRYFTCFGEWGRPDMALFTFTKKILAGDPIDVYGNGKLMRDFTYISDIVDGIFLAVEKDVDYEIFNLGYGAPSLLMDFIKIIEEELGLEAVKNYLPVQRGDVSITYADTTKAKEMLCWEPKIPLVEGVKRFVRWYRDYYHV